MAQSSPDSQFSADDLAGLMRLLRWRRDVRHFLSDPIPPDAIAHLQEAMALAPSVGNARPWRVVQVESPALRHSAREIFRDCNARAATLYQGRRRQEYDTLKLEGMEIAPLQLAIFCLEDPQAGHGLGRQTMPETLRQSAAMAIFALWLAARAQNLGLGMVSILDPQRIEDLLQMPPDWRFTAWLCIGKPAFSDDLPLLHRAGWQENTDQDWQKR